MDIKEQLEITKRGCSELIIEAEFAEIKSQATLELPREEIERIRRYFAAPPGIVADSGETKIARAWPVFLKIPSEPPTPTPTAELLE